MKFSATLSEFQKALQKVLPALPRKTTLPILEHLSFSLKSNELSIIATDQDITIMTTINVSGEIDGRVLVPGKKLNDIVRALGDRGNFDFISDEINFDIKIQTGFGKYNMKGFDPEEFLTLPELFDSEKPDIEMLHTITSQTKPAVFTKEEMIKMAEKTVFAVSSDEYRPAMTGVLFQFRDNYVNAVATDSFRLVKVTISSDANKYPSELNVIIPSRTVDLLKRVESEVLISFIETTKKITHIRFDISETVLVTKIIDEKFPPYESVIPYENKYNVSVSHNELLSSVKRVSIFTSRTSNQIKLIFENDLLTITGEDEEGGTQAKESITCNYQGESINVGFNYKFLEEALQNIDVKAGSDGILLSFNEANRPVIIRNNEEDKELLMLVMPVRI